jgi:hypothetical protein
MKPTRAHTPLRLKGAIFALSLAAMATQVGGASATSGVAAGERPVAQVSAVSLPVPGERELLAWLTGMLRGSPVPGSWALLVAGLAGVWAIGRRRVSAIGDRTLIPYPLRR